MTTSAALRAALKKAEEENERLLKRFREECDCVRLEQQRDTAEARVAELEKALRAIHELVDAELDPGDGCIKEIAAAALKEAKEGAVVLNEAFHEKDKILEGWVGRAERAERRADAAEAKLKKAEAFEVAY